MAYAIDEGPDADISRVLEQNERLKDDLLDLLQQPEDQATDGSIREEFGGLCRSIEFWVDNVIEDSGLERHHRYLGRRERYLLKEVGVNWFTPRDETASAYLLLTVAIQRELQKRIFDRQYPVGITKPQQDVIEQALEGMRTLESESGKVTRDRWKSEAVRALIAHKDFERNRDNAFRAIVETATDFMAPKSSHPICDLSRRAFRNHRDTFCNDICWAAVKLHQSLRSSVHQFTVKHPMIDVDMNGEEMAEMGWILRDAYRWHDLKGINSSARPICPLYPSIVRESSGHGGPETIVPPVVVVELQSSKTSGQSSSAQSSRASPTESLKSETASKDTARHRERRRGHENAPADSARPRDLGRSVELPNPSNTRNGSGVFTTFVNYMTSSGRAETFPTSKPKTPGKGEPSRISGGQSEQKTTEYVYDAKRYRRSPDRVTVIEEDSRPLSPDQVSPERHRYKRRESQSHDESPRRRRTS